MVMVINGGCVDFHNFERALWDERTTDSINCSCNRVQILKVCYLHRRSKETGWCKDRYTLMGIPSWVTGRRELFIDDHVDKERPGRIQIT